MRGDRASPCTPEDAWARRDSATKEQGISIGHIIKHENSRIHQYAAANEKENKYIISTVSEINDNEIRTSISKLGNRKSVGNGGNYSSNYPRTDGPNYTIHV